MNILICYMHESKLRMQSYGAMNMSKWIWNFWDLDEFHLGFHCSRIWIGREIRCLPEKRVSPEWREGRPEEVERRGGGGPSSVFLFLSCKIFNTPGGSPGPATGGQLAPRPVFYTGSPPGGDFRRLLGGQRLEMLLDLRTSPIVWSNFS